MLTRTPRALTRQLEALAAEIAPGSKPVYVPVRAIKDGLRSECFGNVERVIQCHGGSRALGWALWEWPAVMIEAEFHAVWRDSAGQLTDVTPRVDGEKNVLFLPDPSQNWDGRQVNNRRRSMRDDPLVHEFIAVHDRIVEVMNAGERAFQFGAVSVPKTEIAPLMMRSAQLLTQLQQLRSGRNDPCPCGSGRKYKRCCAR